MPADRKRSFRAKYALELGLRPSALDASTREVLKVRCAFCAAFGREPPPLDAQPDAQAPSNSSSTSARRARPRAVASWAPPLRADNIRLHARAQHPARFGAYAALVARAKADGSLRAAADAGAAAIFPALRDGKGDAGAVELSAVTGAARELLTFFGDVQAAPEVENVAAAVAASAPAAVETPAVEAHEGGLVMSREWTPLLVRQIGTAEIVTQLLDSLVNLVDERSMDSEETMLAGRKRRQQRQGGREDFGTDGEQQVDQEEDLEATSYSKQRAAVRLVVTEAGRGGGDKFVNYVKSPGELARAQKLLAMGLSFEQTAQVMGLAFAGFGDAREPVTTGIVAEFARVSVSSALELLSSRMRRSWTYSLAFDLSTDPTAASRPPSSQDAGSSLHDSHYRAIDVRLNLPASLIDGSTDVSSFHLVALPLLPFEHSLERTFSYLTKFLNVLDPAWTRKLLSCSSNVTESAVEIVAGTEPLSPSSLAQKIALHILSSNPTVERPFYRVWRPAQQLSDVMKRALDEIKGAIVVNGVRVDAGYLSSLCSVTTFLRGQERWIRTHGRCPVFNVRCPWSLLEVTQWLLIRREAVTELYAGTTQLSSTIYPSDIFWLVLLTVADMLTLMQHVRDDLDAFPMLPSREARRLLADSARALMDKTGVAFEGGTGIFNTEPTFTFGDNMSVFGGFKWAREPALINYIRSLNLSSRRLYAEMLPASQGRAEFSITCFILRVVYSVAQLAGPEAFYANDAHITNDDVVLDTTNAPPTLPLQFAALSRTYAVDLVEAHSPRLQSAFGSRFLDRISGDMERLRVLAGPASSDPSRKSPFRIQLERMESQSFYSAWDIVAGHGLTSLRRFAAGLATVLPRTTESKAKPAASAHNVLFPASDEDQFRSLFADLAVEARLHCAQATELLQH